MDKKAKTGLYVFLITMTTFLTKRLDIDITRKIIIISSCIAIVLGLLWIITYKKTNYDENSKFSKFFGFPTPKNKLMAGIIFLVVGALGVGVYIAGEIVYNSKI